MNGPREHCFFVCELRTCMKRQNVMTPDGEGNGTPLQYFCLENPMDEGAWWAAVYGVAQSRTRLKRLSSSSSSQDLEPYFYGEMQLVFKFSHNSCSRIKDSLISMITWLRRSHIPVGGILIDTTGTTNLFFLCL